MSVDISTPEKQLEYFKSLKKHLAILAHERLFELTSDEKDAVYKLLISCNSKIIQTASVVEEESTYITNKELINQK